MNADSSSTEKYQKLVDICLDSGWNVKSPLDTMKFEGSNEEKYQRAMKLIKESDFIIAEMSIPSTGQGMELQQAIIEEKPILVIAKKDSKVSSLVTGSNGILDVLQYDDVDEILENIIRIINSNSRKK